MRHYVIGDIHGQIDMLKSAHARIAEDRKRIGDEEAPIIHLGDLVDRGPESAGVIDLLLTGAQNGKPWITLKGNHDRMFSRFLRQGIHHDARITSGLSWLDPRLGGTETLQSYGVPSSETAPQEAQALAAKSIPETHLNFIESLPLTYEAGPLLFVHAGIKPNIPLRSQEEDDLIWIRQGFLDHQEPHQWLIIHGHTALDAPEHFTNRVDLDSGAGYGRPLTAAVIEGRDIFILEDGARRPLLPPAP
ncbi:MAG: metallophosphoesterase [Paracoccaceae bacterium]